VPKGPSRTLVGVLRDDSGQAMLEYIIIVAVVVLAGLAVFKMIANYMKERSISIASVLNES
jgi:Flp pilus assembly pilin Flp